MDEAKNQINNLEHKKEKNHQSEQEKEKRILKNKNTISSLCDNFKCFNIRIIGVTKGEEKEQEIGNPSEKIM